jgi:membrane protein implicated in regulation of membrane protease activity
VGIFYLAALIIGFGTIGLQLLLSGDGDGDADADAHADVDADVHADVHADLHADADAGHAHDFHGAAGFLPIFLSLRFWTFGLLAFGLVGSLLHYLRLAGGLVTPLVAVGMGLVCGFLASWVFRALTRADTTSGVHTRDAVGQVGKVMVSCSKGGRGKVRIELRGQTHDFLVTTDEDELSAGDLVLVEDVRENVLQVARAPAEFLPPKR